MAESLSETRREVFVESRVPRRSGEGKMMRRERERSPANERTRRRRTRRHGDKVVCRGWTPGFGFARGQLGNSDFCFRFRGSSELTRACLRTGFNMTPALRLLTVVVVSACLLVPSLGLGADDANSVALEPGAPSKHVSASIASNIPVNINARLNHLTVGTTYEVRVSHTSEIPVRVSVDVKQTATVQDVKKVELRRRARTMLDLDKAVFVARGREADALIQVTFAGRTAPGISVPTHVPLVLKLEACPLGLPMFAWRAAPAFVVLVMVAWRAATLLSE